MLILLSNQLLQVKVSDCFVWFLYKKAVYQFAYTQICIVCPVSCIYYLSLVGGAHCSQLDELMDVLYSELQLSFGIYS